MVTIVRAVAAVLLLIAIFLHVFGFVTNYWLSANLENKGLSDVMETNGMGSPRQELVGLSINSGLWKYCIKINMGNASNTKEAISEPQDEDESSGENRDLQHSQAETRDSSGSDSLKTSTCQSPSDDDVPGWMKAVRGLGILALVIAVLAIAVMIYSYTGFSKGDHARLLPYIIAGISLAAGLLLLIVVILYAVKFEKMLKDTKNILPPVLAENIMKHSKLGYSFVLEAVSCALFVLASPVLVIPVMMGRGRALQFDSWRNMAV